MNHVAPCWARAGFWEKATAKSLALATLPYWRLTKSLYFGDVLALEAQGVARRCGIRPMRNSDVKSEPFRPYHRLWHLTHTPRKICASLLILEHKLLGRGDFSGFGCALVLQHRRSD